MPRFRPTLAEEKNEIGVATGLAWTEVGGEILVIEATLMPGKGKLTLTGKLGDVMQESAQAAMSYVRSQGRRVPHPEELQPHDRRARAHPRRRDPEGRPVGRHHARDGAGLGARAASPVRKDVAMTGEITLRGKVLPIGGVKEKVLGAHRAGLKTIIVPRDNEKDLADIPKNVLDTLDIYMVESMDEVLKIALAEPLPGDRRAAARRSSARHHQTNDYALRSRRIGDRGPGFERVTGDSDGQPASRIPSHGSRASILKILTADFVTSAAAGGRSTASRRRTRSDRARRAIQCRQVDPVERARRAQRRAHERGARQDAAGQHLSGWRSRAAPAARALERLPRRPAGLRLRARRARTSADELRRVAAAYFATRRTGRDPRSGGSAARRAVGDRPRPDRRADAPATLLLVDARHPGLDADVQAVAGCRPSDARTSSRRRSTSCRARSA